MGRKFDIERPKSGPGRKARKQGVPGQPEAAVGAGAVGKHRRVGSKPKSPAQPLSAAGTEDEDGEFSMHVYIPRGHSHTADTLLMPN